MNEIRVLIAICHNSPVIDRRVCESLIGLGFGNRIPEAKAAYGIAEIALAWYTKMPRVDALRNIAIDQARKDGFTHVLFLDADMIFPDDLLQRILRHHAVDGPVSGFYTQRHYPYGPIAFRNATLHESGKYFVYTHDEAYTEVDARGLRAEDMIGMGCCLIPLQVIDAIGPRPWFEYRDDDQGWPMITEDVPFCEKVRQAGFGIYLDPSIQCGHLFQDFATEAHWKRSLEIRQHTIDQIGQHLTITASRAETEAPA